ncbi:hypothetical protein [Diaphorobacter sp.]|uniref:hypothetical protein n=1 Tax=Diaphorobacter sp. TaxID=1934310 RepID=UPI0028AC6CDF|nr:hypothetical protein [Diaphorobacter sp.]
MIFEIKDFIVSSKISNVGLRASKAEIDGILPAPEAVSLARFPKIYKYGPLQITIYESEVVSIKIIISADQALWKGVDFPDYNFFCKMTCDDVEKYLSSIALDYHIICSEHMNKYIKTYNEVCFYFDENKLEAIGCSLF